MVRSAYNDEGYHENDPEDESRDGLAPLLSEQLLAPRLLERDISVSSLGEEAMSRLLLPADDPLLSADVIEPEDHDDSPHAISHDFHDDDDDDGWETTSSDSSFDSEEYRANDDDEDDDDTRGISSTFFSFTTSDNHKAAVDAEAERFIDSGWGGECLREVEDIDFEFVYALHTFVATVEGQANATKGDTMVLLDDSNSYWWLVRIVKDSSIGTYPHRPEVRWSLY